MENQKKIEDIDWDRGSRSKSRIGIEDRDWDCEIERRIGIVVEIEDKNWN
jgi:hypothetical protein